MNKQYLALNGVFYYKEWSPSKQAQLHWNQDYRNRVETGPLMKFKRRWEWVWKGKSEVNSLSDLNLPQH